MDALDADDHFPNDDLFPDVENLFDDMADKDVDPKTNASAAAPPLPFAHSPREMRSRRRRRHARSPPAAPLDDDDLLSEILLRLPPQPSSLPRASLVCKRWRSLLSDPGFFRRFRLRHRHNPSLLGFFDKYDGLSFLPTLGAPNRLPPGRFSLPRRSTITVFPLDAAMVSYSSAREAFPGRGGRV
uniref:Uncharacterized protein n=1 Tax=Aegilops tauschii TaxID=37682 RepID=M8CCM0_AEGTA